MRKRGLQLGILVNSEIFVRGLHSSLENVAPGTIHVRVLTPGMADQEIRRGLIDILILDSDLAESVKNSLDQNGTCPKVILVSERRHPGTTLPISNEKICGFFPARSPEMELRDLLNSILECHSRPPSQKCCNECSLPKTLAPRKLSLSDREKEIFQLIGQLHSTAEIADQLNISVKTVEAHCTNIKRKLKLNNSRELLKEAIHWVEGLK